MSWLRPLVDEALRACLVPERVGPCDRQGGLHAAFASASGRRARARHVDASTRSAVSTPGCDVHQGGRTAAARGRRRDEDGSSSRCRQPGIRDVAKLRPSRSATFCSDGTNSPELVGKSADLSSGASASTFASYLDDACDCTVRVAIPRWAMFSDNGPSGGRHVAEVRTQQVGRGQRQRNESSAAIPIAVPPLDEQRRIVAAIEEQLSAIDALRAAIERAQRRSASLRRAVLERAFRGELVPQDPSDESASVLLERIRAERAAASPGARRSRSRANRTVP